MRHAPVLAAMLAGSLAATCSAEPEAEPRNCSTSARSALFEKRIAPLLAEDRPKSCNECHLSGVDLSLFVRDDPCQSMACLVELGLVDLDAPQQSTILSWIDRANPKSDGITPTTLAEERAGFEEWIADSAECGLCYQGKNPCGESGKYDDCSVLEEDPTSYTKNDPGGCDDQALETLFLNSFFPYRLRCFPCHFEGTEQVPEAPRWIATGPCNIASLRTYRNVIDRELINVDAPAQSKWVLKPLEEDLGGTKHGGGPKFHSLDEEAYVRMVYFAERYAECKKTGEP